MPIRYAFYGDDFTGSTDVLEQLASNGVPVVLFLGPPTAEHLAAFPGVEAIGIAGDSRSRSPVWMSAHLPEIFMGLKEFGAPLMHYKICSTFDSSPACGSIGRAMEIGRDIFSPSVIPIVVGAPHLRRYVAFGNLFAADADGKVVRIDRHPMSRHPVTPMREADLRAHLAAQTRMKIGLVDGPTLEGGNGSEAVAALVAAGHQAVLFDTIDARTQAAVGELLWSLALQRPLFSASSSGLTAALISAWSTLGIVIERPVGTASPATGPLLVVSGSCSAVTERQLRYAFDHGYHGIPIEPVALLDPLGRDLAAAMDAGMQSLSAGQDTILYTTLGTPAGPVQGEELGVALGGLLREILICSNASGIPVRRVLICGGDTTSHAVQQLGVYALTWVANLQPGAPLCRAHADSELHDLEVVLKGGQVGTDNFFDVVRGG
jgi:3-oxoisoapionate kinase